MITFTSPSTVKNLSEIMGKEINKLLGTPTVCIGPVTARTAREYGFNVIAVAEEHSIEGLVETLASY